MHSGRRTFLPAFAAAIFFLSGASFASGDPKSEIPGGFDLRAYRAEETLRLAGRKLESPSVRYEDLMDARNSLPGRSIRPGGKKKMAIAMVASAILPGAGELYLYFDSGYRPALYRAPVFMALDAYLWYGYKTNLDKGKDFKSEYEDYCDAHWSEARFLLQHPWCEGLGPEGCTDYQQYNENASEMQQFFFIYMPKSQDREEYYENCGKYDAFAFGWDDWDPTGWDGSYETFEPWTPHRTEYWSIRDESDKYLVRADQHVMLAIVNRVLSVLDAAWIAYTINRGDDDYGGLNIEFRPDSRMPTVGVNYRF
ncbi:MAG: hypothetical protein MUF59_04260 [Candidatus Krumholzibacteria bacterium]|jgi:hypothetical protein|nr:hypothetical protein [Candidatus Krumholzibacteria bacterium]